MGLGLGTGIQNGIACIVIHGSHAPAIGWVLGCFVHVQMQSLIPRLYVYQGGMLHNKIRSMTCDLLVMESSIQR